jgi:hypothetical protein
MNFIPLKGTDKIRFGMKREEVREALDLDFRNFLRNELAENPTDYYPDLKLFVEYNQNDVCEAIEFTNEGKLIWEGANLCAFNYDKLVKKLDTLSERNETEDGIGKTYHDLGISVTESAESEYVEAVMIFSENYW